MRHVWRAVRPGGGGGPLARAEECLAQAKLDEHCKVSQEIAAAVENLLAEQEADDARKPALVA